MPKRNALGAAVTGLAVLAVLVGLPAPAPGGEQPPLKGVFADNFTLFDPPVPAPLTAFQDAGGQPVSMADFAGEVVLVNFWATWCAPCVREMPTFDRLQSKLGEDGLNVVAISQDRGGVAVVLPFFKEHGLTELAVYLDPKNAVAAEFGIAGLPTTLLIDARGLIVGALQGPAEWDSEDAQALIRHYLEQAKPDNPVKTSG